MKRIPQTWLFVILVFLLPFTAYVLFTWYQQKFTALPVYGAAIIDRAGNKTAHHISSFNLINQDNKIITEKNWNGKIVIADFFFTHCLSVCPKMTSSLKHIQQAFTNDNSICITSFTVDPENDSTLQLKQYAERFNINNANWELLTGDKKEIYKLARNGFMLVATDGDGGATDFIHSDKLVLIDKQKRIRGYYDGTNENEIEQLIKDIKKLQNEN